MRVRAILAAVALATLPVAAPAGGWGGFYTATENPARPAKITGAPQDVCLSEILAAEARHGIPGNLLLAIGFQEAGTHRDGELTVWPHAVNAAGEGRLFESQGAAMDWVRQRRAAGVSSIDVGCMQINLRWHPDAFATLADGFDPRTNVDYAARFLTQLRREEGSWSDAASAYHSRERQYRDAYARKLKRNIVAARAHAPRIAARLRTGTARAVEVARGPAPAMGWGSSLSGGGQGTLYGRADLQPILPPMTRVPG